MSSHEQKKIQFHGGYVTRPLYISGMCMVLEGDWDDRYRCLFDKYNITSLRLASSAGWKEDNVDFLTQLDERIKGIEIYSLRVRSVAPIQQLPWLVSISLELDRNVPYPDFSAFPDMEDCFLSRWGKNAEKVLNCTRLTQLNVIGVPYQDLEALSLLGELRMLKLTQCVKLLSFDGAERLRSLHHLECVRCPGLSNIEALAACQELQYVEFTVCRRIQDVTALSELRKLRALHMEDCGKIRSVGFLKKCRQLETLLLMGDTDVVDGDLSIFMDLPGLRNWTFAKRRHYLHSEEQIREMLSNRKCK